MINLHFHFQNVEHHGSSILKDDQKMNDNYRKPATARHNQSIKRERTNFRNKRIPVNEIISMPKKGTKETSTLIQAIQPNMHIQTTFLFSSSSFYRTIQSPSPKSSHVIFPFKNTNISCSIKLLKFLQVNKEKIIQIVEIISSTLNF